MPRKMKVMEIPEGIGHRLLTTAEVAEITGLKANYLRQLKHKGTGPQVIKIGGMVRYRIADVVRWINCTAVVERPQSMYAN